MKSLTYSIGVPVALTITVVVGSNHVRGWSEACADDEIYDNGKGIYRHAQGDEEEEDFIDRCMVDDTMEAEYPDQKQRFAVCKTQWQNKK